MNMEKEFFVNDGCSNFYGIDFNPNWDNNNSMMDQGDLFDSTLTSIVSSPVNSHAGNLVGGGGGGGENVMMRELLGRLGSICNSGEIGTITNNSSSYNNTPLNSPPKRNLSVMESQIRGNLSLSGSNLAPFSADPGFAERAARLSCFGNGGRNLSSLNELGKVESGKLSRVSSNKSFSIAGIGSQLGIQEKGGDLIPVPNKKLNRFSRSSTPENNAGDSREGSSVSEHITSRELGGSKANTRKRKSVHTGEAKDTKAAVTEKNESNGKKIKPNEVPKKEMDAAKDGTKTDEDANQKQTNDNSKPPEPLKDYIHVRARRGQATDSHSLAERVRREKISKRMKFLQDLVPGCNKVTGKAVMLDEIINYVQSLQRQVEFLSMKLATVNPRMDLNMETLLSKDIFKCPGSLPHTLHPLDSSVPTFPYEYQSMHMPSLHNDISHGTEKQFPITSATDLMQRNLSGQVPNGYSEVGIDISKFWENDLHSLVHMGYGQNQLQNDNGPMAANQMKSEL